MAAWDQSTLTNPGAQTRERAVLAHPLSSAALAGCNKFCLRVDCTNRLLGSNSSLQWSVHSNSNDMVCAVVQTAVLLRQPLSERKKKKVGSKEKRVQ